VTHYEVIEAFRFGVACWRSNSRPGGPTRSASTWPPIKHPCCGDPLYGADPRLARRLGLERQWLHAVGPRFRAPRHRRVGHLHQPYPADLDARARGLAAAH
jgi:23S rRNA pseudouridine1911/1915/1917 synthase